MHRSRTLLLKPENRRRTELTLTNVRTGFQETIAEISARKSDVGFDFGGLGVGGSLSEALETASVGSAYTSTDIGKIVAAAFLDAHNKLVVQKEGETQ